MQSPDTTSPERRSLLERDTQRHSTTLNDSKRLPFADTMGPPENPYLPRLTRRRRGKIGHLAESVRHQINVMLEENLPYKEIIPRLGERCPAPDKNNLSRWPKADRQD